MEMIDDPNCIQITPYEVRIGTSLTSLISDERAGMMVEKHLGRHDQQLLGSIAQESTDQPASQPARPANGWYYLVSYYLNG